MSDLIIKKNGTDYKLPMLAEHYPADRVYLDGDTSKTVQGAIDEIQSSVTNVEDMLTVKSLSGFDVACYKYGKIIEAIIEVTPSAITHGSVIIAKVPRAHRTLYLSLNMTSGQSVSCVLENVPGQNYAQITAYFPGAVNIGRIDENLIYIGE